MVYAICKGGEERPLRGCWQTPRDLFDQLHAVFQFTIDAAASVGNALLPRYWTEEDDCLKQDWSSECVFVNPPYHNLRPFVGKAATARCCLMVMPVTTLTTAYTGKVPPKYVVVPPWRVKCDPPPGLVTSAVSPSLGTIFTLYGAVTEAQLSSLRGLGLLVYKFCG
jgi:hypothetical protein